MTFDMNRTWAQSLAMVRANWQYLSLIAGVFFLLPNLVLVIAMPDMMGMLIGPGGDPDRPPGASGLDVLGHLSRGRASARPRPPSR